MHIKENKIKQYYMPSKNTHIDNCKYLQEHLIYDLIQQNF